MDNKQIRQQLRLAADLMELHGADAFKVKSFRNAVRHLEQHEAPLESLSQEAMQSIEGIGKGMAGHIRELVEQGYINEVQELWDQTPAGILELMQIKGIGPKRTAAIRENLGLKTPEALLEACEAGQVAGLKGFGEKTEAAMADALRFYLSNKGKLLYAEAEPAALRLEQALQQSGVFNQLQLAGDFRRKMPVIASLDFIAVPGQAFSEVPEQLRSVNQLQYTPAESGPYVWRGRETETGLQVSIHMYSNASYAAQLLIHSAARAHLKTPLNGENFLQKVLHSQAGSEEALYEAAGLPYIPPVRREGIGEMEAALTGKQPELIQEKDLKGILHNHSTYSDGKHSLRAMAEYCRDLGYAYLGISDHSQSAFYANGLQPERIRKQHQEIDELNQELAPFKIFKGIESDILNDGRLDYEEDTLNSFDFIVASIHGNLRMDRQKATERLLKAIAHPATSILGHPTGRLLLRREGYPIDHKAVIDACAYYGVAIEINANPWRLDLDWHWIPYALEQDVMISINPDAHEKDGYADMRYGVYMGQKGGLTPEKTLNALSLDELTAWFRKQQEHK